MNYHIEHHMFPMVPYYNLPELHKVLQVGGEMPKPYAGMFEVYCEMIPALIRRRFALRPWPRPRSASMSRTMAITLPHACWTVLG